MTIITYGNTRAILCVDNPNWLSDSIKRHELNKRRIEVESLLKYSNSDDLRAELVQLTADIFVLNRKLGNSIK